MYEPPKVTLLTWTMDPLETVYAVWDASKTENKLMTTEEVRDTVPTEDVEELFRAVVAQRIPVGEHVDFVFLLENVSVSWREQAVRHRIGTRPSPERIGADIVVDQIPDLADSSWWSQSMRIMDMGQFATEGRYRLPETVHKDQEAADIFHETMRVVEHGYRKLVERGIPMEDARELIPLGTHHRISWKLNMAALQHIVGKRGCWILQLGIWGPVIEGMIQELTRKVHPIFSEMVTPPCLTGDKFTGCIYHEENRRRISGEDKLPLCSLYAFNEMEPEDANKAPMQSEMTHLSTFYRQFWNRDPFTGKRLGGKNEI